MASVLQLRKLARWPAWQPRIRERACEDVREALHRVRAAPRSALAEQKASIASQPRRFWAWAAKVVEEDLLELAKETDVAGATGVAGAAGDQLPASASGTWATARLVLCAAPNWHQGLEPIAMLRLPYAFESRRKAQGLCSRIPRSSEECGTADAVPSRADTRDALRRPTLASTWGS